MKPTLAALFASIVVHAVLIGVLLELHSERVELAAIAPASSSQPIEIEIAIVTRQSSPSRAESGAAASGVASSEASKSPVRVRAAKKARGASKGTAEGTSSSPGLERPGILSELETLETPKERAVDLKLRPDFEVGTTTEPAKKSKPLAPSEGGGYRYDDSRFTMSIAPDGTVELEDKANVDLKDPLSPGRAKDDPLNAMGGLNPFVREDSAEESAAGPNVPPIQGVARTGTLDFNDTILGALGEDPNAYEKRKAMRETAELRAQLCERNQVERMRASLLELPEQLDAIWAKKDRSALEKRAALFSMWDDCVEDGDEQIAKYSEAARATIVAFIQKNLPASHRDAYAAEELARLNSSRRSRERFDPYAGTIRTRDAGT